MSLSVIQVVPRVPPAVCGIGDYATQLARHLSKDHDIATRFVVAGIEGADATAAEFPIQRVPAGDILALRAAVAGKADALILHVSTYGYQKRGVPLWLAEGLNGSAGVPIVAMFHELYATGAPSSSAFWLQPLQKMILRKIVRNAARLRTNRKAYAQWINGVPVRKAPPATVMPVFSNLGELQAPPALADRPDSMVMFASGIHGGGDFRGTVVRGAALCQKLALRSLQVLGVDASAETIDGVSVLFRKFLPADDLSQLLAACRVAFTTYSPKHLAKSGVFAAYASHGLAVVVSGEEREMPDGLCEGREVTLEQSVLRDSLRPENLQSLANGLRRWYAGHSVCETARSFAADVRGVAGGGK
jgi:hypothetical protein